MRMRRVLSQLRRLRCEFHALQANPPRCGVADVGQLCAGQSLHCREAPRGAPVARDVRVREPLSLLRLASFYLSVACMCTERVHKADHGVDRQRVSVVSALLSR